MKKAWTVVIATVAVTVMLLSFYLLGGLAQDPEGFNEGDLNPPEVTSILRDEASPGPLTELDFHAHLTTGISYTPIYEVYGGIVELVIENLGSNQVYVRWYSIGWEGGNETYSLNCSMLIEPGEAGNSGVLYLPGPGVEGNATFEVRMDLWASSSNGNLWCDKGELLVDSHQVEVLPEGALRDREVQRNPVRYYNQVNELVDLYAVQAMKGQVLGAVPGVFSVHQAIVAYELVRTSILYAEDEDNHWQSAAETIELGTGDCEDQAILLASLLTAMGGDCRVNLITGHAFPSLYIGNSTSEISDVRENIRTYYGNDVPVHWTEDELGYWLIVDTVGMPYAGGYPAASVPIGALGGTDWNSENGDTIRTIDVTGETVPGLVL
ncbi:MAG: transglutaminase family protein [Methanomassiliicoccales archaeon]|nr:transglutaminase family protein [Methanomassiliicoccales archaeon]